MSDQDVASGKADAETVRKAVAKHALVDAQGAEVENEEEANGARYTLLANGQSYVYQYGTATAVDKMLAIFGAKTLMTNETSQVRGNPKGSGSPDEQIQAVRDRFDFMIAEGKWLDRTREPGVGVSIDKDALAEAIVQQFEADSITLPSGGKAAIRQKLEDDKTYVSKTRRHLGVATKYAAIVGKASVSTDDLTF